MVAVIEKFLESYNNMLYSMPEHLRIIPPLFFIAVVIAVYSLFVWFFYRSLANRDVLKLNLAQYNRQEHSGWVKFFAVLLYIVEFIIIGPIAIFFWFAVLSIFLIILAKEIEVGNVILICAALISAVRITAYFREDLSKDLAKMVPFTLLGVTILTPSFIDISTSVERITQVPLFFNNALYYLIFIVALETVLRLFFLFIEISVSMKEE